MATDAVQSVLTMLSTAWTAGNTDSVTPQFVKITSSKELAFHTYNDWILAHRARPKTEPGGIGKLVKHKHFTIDLDIRINGQAYSSPDDHFLKVVEEVERVLDSKIVAPASGFDVLDPDIEKQDLSDKSFNLYRMVLTLKITQLSVARGS